MSKKLVLYFSVYGTAKKVAEEIARQTGADLTLVYVKLYINQFMRRSIKCRVTIRNAVIQHDLHHLS